jgi:putative ABC transport system permease protein
VSVGVLERPVTGSAPEPTTGGVPARRAMIRWAWRLFKREWRQQLLILLLVIVAVAAVVVGAAVAVNTPPPANAGYGTADDLATYTSTGTASSPPISICTRWTPRSPRSSTASARSRSSRTRPSTCPRQHPDLPTSVPGPARPLRRPMLQLLSGHYPTGPNQIALTPGLASELNLRWATPGPRRQDRRRHRAEPPEPARRVRAGSAGTGDAPDHDRRPLRRTGRGPGPNRVQRLDAGLAHQQPDQPDTIVLALATVGMLLIALVSVGGFTVLAQRRLRAIGMLESMGATDRNVRLVLEANGVIVGAVGAVVGFGLGLVAWLAYRPHNEQSAHHLIPMFALPWTVIVVAMVLAVVATFFAAGHPARAMTRVPVVSALAGRPAPPRQIHRSFVPGVIALVIGFVFFSLSGAAGNGSGVIWLIPGFVALIAGIILVSPFFLALLARVGRKAPIAVRLALRDLSRYRARSGSALSAISVGVLIAVVICAVAVARYSNVYDYVGPNLASNELAVWSPNGQNGNSPNPSAPTPQASRRRRPASTPSHPLSAPPDVVELDNPASSVGLQNPSASGRQWDGQIYVATPALLRAYGINPSSIPSDVDVLSSRPGLSGSGVQLTYGGGGGKGGGQLVGPGSGAGGPGGGGSRPGKHEHLLTRKGASPTRSSKKRASCPRARMRRTR